VKDWQVKCQHLETQLRQKTLELSKAKKAAPVAPQPSKFKEPQLQDGEKYTSFRWRVIMNQNQHLVKENQYLRSMQVAMRKVAKETSQVLTKLGDQDEAKDLAHRLKQL
jgi:hypothetical protein